MDYYYKCDICGKVYWSDIARPGWTCIHCPGKIVKTTKEEYDELICINLGSVEYPTHSC